MTEEYKSMTLSFDDKLYQSIKRVKISIIAVGSVLIFFQVTLAFTTDEKTFKKLLPKNELDNSADEDKESSHNPWGAILLSIGTGFWGLKKEFDSFK